MATNDTLSSSADQAPDAELETLHVRLSQVLAYAGINQARSFIYSTALPPALAATADHVIREIFCRPNGQQLREKLWRNIASLRSLFPDPQSAILPLILGGEAVAMEASARLQALGLWIPAIRFPTVARGSARLRITISAAHQPSELIALSEALQTLER